MNYKVGDKVKVLTTKSTINGTLYEGTIVTIDDKLKNSKDYRVIDDLGKIWYVLPSDMKKMWWMSFWDKFLSIYMIFIIEWRLQLFYNS